MTNPFDNEEQSFFVLVNHEGQHSLWPQFAQIPAGWEPVFGPEARRSCLDYVEENWQDMRPRSLIEALASTAEA